MAKHSCGVLCELVDEAPSLRGQDDTIRIQKPTVRANKSGVDLTLCLANHSTHSFLACKRVHSECWMDDHGDCTAPTTPFPPQVTCTNQIERVPYSLVGFLCSWNVSTSPLVSVTPCIAPLLSVSLVPGICLPLH
ncbi:hypothetical protein BaRGS_00013316 [Batillaria attramentaria]|uniref:Uncharacterized protein n=1 Tax=Batillaria attramentaria TaxID=370345 RepID=A0ABD0L7C3_9CAEN